MRHLRREDGAIELFVALALVAILGITALVVDIGNAKQARRNFQTAADSGSLAGAQKLVTAATPAVADAFAADYAFDSMNQARGSSVACPGSPFPAAPVGAVCFQSSAGAVVYATTPYTCPTTQPGVSSGSGVCTTAPDKNSTINVRVCQKLNTSFARILKINSTMVCNSSTSTGAPSVGNCVLCVMSTAANTCTFDLVGNAAVNVTGVPPGPILVNDPNSGAVCGNGNTNVTSPGGFYYVGCGTSCGQARWTTQPVSGPSSQDPLRNVQPPSVAGSAQTCADGATCNPGVYSTITATHSTTTLNPGVYVVTGSINMGQNGTLIGNNVMIYLTCSGYSTSNTAPCHGDGANFSGNGGAVRLTAPTTPATNPYKGLLIFADRGNTATILDSNGNITYTTTGTVYALNADVSLGGTSGATMDSRFIVGTLEMHGTPNINEIYSDQFQGLPTVGGGISLVG